MSRPWNDHRSFFVISYVCAFCPADVSCQFQVEFACKRHHAIRRAVLWFKCCMLTPVGWAYLASLRPCASARTVPCIRCCGAAGAISMLFCGDVRVALLKCCNRFRCPLVQPKRSSGSLDAASRAHGNFEDPR